MSMKKTLICKQNLFGGTDFLLSRYEEWLKSKNYVVKSVDVNNLQLLKNETWDVVILPSSEIDQLYTLHKNDVVYKGVIVYILGMGTIRDSYFNPKRNGKLENYLTKISNQFLYYLYKNNSIVFTDSVGFYNNFNNTGIEVAENNDKMLIPIGISIPKNTAIGLKDNGVLKCYWIGRVSKDFKMKSVENLIVDLNEINKDHRINLTIIGEGDGLSEVKKSAINSNLEISFIKNIEKQEINDYFIEHVDLCIAMGTSALDSAKNGIPTVVISPIREFDIEKANYRWIFESKGYSLGEYVGEKNSTNQIKRDLSTLIKEYENNQDIGDKCRAYSLNFEDEVVFNKLVNYNNLPLDNELIKHARRYYYLKNVKKSIKKVVKRNG